MSVKLVCKQDSIGWAGSSATKESVFFFLRASVSSLVKWGQFRAQVGGQNTSSEANVGGSKIVTSGGKGQGVMVKWPLLNEQICYLRLP